MKKKKYENNFSVSIGIFLLLLFEFVFLIFLLNKKIQVYKTINGIILNDTIVLFLNKEDRNRIYANTFLFIDGNKEEYKIHNDLGFVYKEKGISYYQLELSVDNLDDYKNNDPITMSINYKKIKMIEIFQIILEGD